MTTTDRPASVAGEAAGAGHLPLTDQAAAWIRANAWTDAMRTRHALPGDRRKCQCQFGPSHACGRGEHDQCPDPFRTWHTLIRRPDGTVAEHREPYRHPTESDLGPHYERAAFVWHADRVCRWLCPCSCHTALAAPRPAQDALFEVTA